jgi:predicted Zn-dependent protease
VRWPERQAEPLRVWIARTSGVGNWNPEFPMAAERAFAEWRAAGFPIDFHFVHDSASAQIRIGWTEKFTEADSQQIGLARKEYDRSGWLLAAEIRLATHSVRGRTLSPELITGVARHEVGHALGLGHSSNRGDVMYPEAYTTDISAADRATLHLLYKLPPGIMP